MPPRRCLPSPVLTRLSSVGGLKGGLLAWWGRAPPARVIARGTCSTHLIFVVFVLVVALFALWLRLLSGFPFLPCYV